MKTNLYTQDLEILEQKYNEAKNSPWCQFFRLSWGSVLETLELHGLNAAKELIRKSDIKAYRTDEALNGDI